MSAANYLDIALRAEPVATLVKVTVILGTTCLVSVLLRRTSAAVRHVVWLAGIVSAAWMMLLSPVAPGIPVVVSREPAVAARPDVRPIQVSSSPTSTPIHDAASAMRALDVGSSRAEAISPSVSRRAADWLRGSGKLDALLLVWAIGMAFVIARAIVGHVAVARLVRRARVLSRDESWIARDVRLLMSPHLAAPVTTSWLTPAIILPESAANWSAERRHIVLVHELAHIRRGDYVAQVVATIAFAILWFHPLAWIAVARLKAEAEQAADDVVLSSGTSGIAYASHLLDLARDVTPLRLSAAVTVGMVRSPRIERRFRAILDDRRARRGLGWRAIGSAAFASMVVMSPLAGVRTVARAMKPPIQSPSAPLKPAPLPDTVAAPTPRGVVPTPPAAPTRLMTAPSDIDSIIEQSIDAVPGGRLRISLETGGGVIVRGTDSSRIRVRASLGGQDWRDVRVTLAGDGRQAGLSSTFAHGGTHGTELWFEISVPRRTDIDLSSAGGSADFAHIDGSLNGQTGGGELTIRDTRGRANLSTGGGEITIADSHLDGIVRTGWGRVDIQNNSGDLQGLSNGSRGWPASGTPPPDWPVTATTSRTASTTNYGSCLALNTGEPVTTHIVESGERWIRATAPLLISKPGGSIEVAVAPQGATLSTGGGRIVVDSSGQLVVASTGGGDITLGAATGAAVASTGAGNVSIRVVGDETSSHNINVCDGSGRVELELPADFDGTFELETAYTDNHPAPTSIASDFGLSRSETHEWDDRFGTPRKFVRGTGTVGAGSNLIRVSTVNGDIVVRRR